MLTEKEAWLKLAEWRRQPKGSVVLGKDFPNTSGLCYDIACLFAADEISGATEDAMFERLDEFESSSERKHFGFYYWPRTDEGDEQRIAF
jgi:hypothetical protein